MAFSFSVFNNKGAIFILSPTLPPSFSPSLFHLFQSNQRLLFLPPSVGGAGREETDGIVCKRKAEKSHIYLSALWQI